MHFEFLVLTACGRVPFHVWVAFRVLSFMAVFHKAHTHTQTHSVVCIFDMTMISRFNRIFTFIAGHENFFVHIFYVSISDGIVKKK